MALGFVLHPLKRCVDNIFHLFRNDKDFIGKKDYAFGGVHKIWA
jgi:hypothetical protein